MVISSFFGVFMQCVHFYKKIGRYNFLSNYVEFKLINFLLHQFFFALQAIYRYLIVMKNVNIGYNEIGINFLLRNLIH
jgi:hypothetical protein